MDRRKFLKGVGVAGVAGLAGCTGGPDDGTETETGGDGDATDAGTPMGNQSAGTDAGTTEEGTDAGTDDGTDAGGDGETTYVGMVYATGGLGDGSFNDQAQSGLQQASEEFDIQSNESEPSQVSEFSTFQQSYAESQNPDWDLVSCIGFLQAEALASTSEQYPDQDFMIVDAEVDAPNVANYLFAEHEGSYLAGQMAGLLTTEEFSAGQGETNGDPVVGFVGGVQGALIEKFEAGYKAGVNAANSDVEVLTTYVGAFDDPTGGQQAANSMYNRGADIVYHAAGNTGTGVFSAAQSAGRFAIGVDRDQSVTRPSFSDVILASMVKRVDTAVYNAIAATVNDEFPAGSTTALGLEDEGVALVYGQGIGSEIPGDVRSQVEESRQAIIAGDIEVPTDPSNV